MLLTLPLSMRLTSIKIQFTRYSGSFVAKRALHKNPIRIQWFYATDVPNSKPARYNYKMETEPTKFLPFSDYDTSNLERKYKQFHLDKKDQDKVAVVEVNEDKLFEVDLETLLLSPIYWEGPIYEVRRGTWFTTDGIPLAFPVAKAIEENYQTVKPYNFTEVDHPEDISARDDMIKKFDNFKGMVQSDKFDITHEKDIIELPENYVLFYNDRTAAMFPKDTNSRFQLGVIRQFGAQQIPLVKVQYIQRGYSDDMTETIFDNIPSNPLPAVSDIFEKEFSRLFGSSGEAKEKPPPEEIEQQKSEDMEKIMESDFELEVTSQESNREIDHLVLCIHGIGQVLGDQYESINFTHSINVLRNTMRKVYQSNEQYKKLAYQDGEASDSNNKIQVLPINWRHKVDFDPKTQFSNVDENGNFIYPSLSDITIDGIRPLRNVVGDVLLDILLYYEPRYIEQIFGTVTEELNRVYKLYMEKNPNFKGKVHIMGHLLGSAISFDILSLQTDKKDDLDLTRDLSFDVENLFCVGCPVGVFKLLKKVKIASRASLPADFEPSQVDNIEAPKCKNLYNVFHPCDPVGYRMEPLVNPVLAKYKPENIPFAMEGFSKGLSDLGGDITNRLLQASSWFSGKKATKSLPKGRIEDENALGDIVSSLVANEKQPTKDTSKKVDMHQDDLDQLVELNRTGRVDYSLPMGVFDISLVSAISAHVSYFEDEDTAGFMMKEILTSTNPPVETKSVRRKA